MTMLSGGRPIEPERGEILGDKHHLSQLSRGRERINLVEHGIDRPRPLSAPEARDRTEPAMPVAALGHLDKGPGSGRSRASQIEQIEVDGHRAALEGEVRTAETAAAAGFTGAAGAAAVAARRFPTERHRRQPYAISTCGHTPAGWLGVDRFNERGGARPGEPDPERSDEIDLG